MNATTRFEIQDQRKTLSTATHDASRPIILIDHKIRAVVGRFTSQSNARAAMLRKTRSI